MVVEKGFDRRALTDSKDFADEREAVATLLQPSRDHPARAKGAYASEASSGEDLSVSVQDHSVVVVALLAIHTQGDLHSSSVVGEKEVAICVQATELFRLARCMPEAQALLQMGINRLHGLTVAEGQAPRLSVEGRLLVKDGAFPLPSAPHRTPLRLLSTGFHRGPVQASRSPWQTSSSLSS